MNKRFIIIAATILMMTLTTSPNIGMMKKNQVLRTWNRTHSIGNTKAAQLWE